jgi:glycine cleavage system transcriptional repressor
MQTKQYLSVMMLGPDNSEILKTVSFLIVQHDCQMVNCHILSQGELYQVNFLLSGEWSALAKIEPKLKKLEQKYTLTVFVESYKTRQTGTPMIAITVKIQINTDTSLSDWRERFMLFCDDLNIDAIMEPEKP